MVCYFLTVGFVNSASFLSSSNLLNKYNSPSMDDKVEAQMSKSNAIHIPNPVLSAMFCMI